jgi:hypothetical protein
MKAKKGSTRYFRPYDNSLELAQKICEATGLEQQTLFSMVMQAGLEAIAENNFLVSLPIKFTYVQPMADGKSRPSMRATRH